MTVNTDSTVINLVRPPAKVEANSLFRSTIYENEWTTCHSWCVVNPNWKYEARAERETRMKERTGKIMMDKKDARWHSNVLRYMMDLSINQENQQMNSCVHYLFQNRSMKRILKEDVRVSLTGISFLVGDVLKKWRKFGRLERRIVQLIYARAWNHIWIWSVGISSTVPEFPLFPDNQILLHFAPFICGWYKKGSSVSEKQELITSLSTFFSLN